MLDGGPTFATLDRQTGLDQCRAYGCSQAVCKGAVSHSGCRAEPAHMGGGDRFGGLIEHYALYRVADVTAIEHVGNVGQRDHHEAASVSRERGFDALLHGEEWQRIIVIDAVGITYGDAHLSDAPQALLN